MLRMLVLLSTLTCSSIVQADLNAEPFGVEMGMSWKELIHKLGITDDNELVISADKFHILTSKAVKNSPHFDTYIYTATPSTGLCRVIAQTRVFRDSAAFSNSFNAIKADVITEYGLPIDSGNISAPGYDYLNGLEGVAKKKRIMFAAWKPSKSSQGKTKDAKISRPDNLDQILLDTMAFTKGGLHGLVQLAYTFNNGAKCLEIVRASKAKNTIP